MESDAQTQAIYLPGDENHPGLTLIPAATDGAPIVREESASFALVASGATIPIDPTRLPVSENREPEMAVLAVPSGSKLTKGVAKLSQAGNAAYLLVLAGAPSATSEQGGGMASANRDGDIVRVQWRRGEGAALAMAELHRRRDAQKADAAKSLQRTKDEETKWGDAVKDAEEKAASGRLDAVALQTAKQTAGQMVGYAEDRAERLKAAVSDSELPDVTEAESGEAILPYGPGATIEII